MSETDLVVALHVVDATVSMGVVTIYRLREVGCRMEREEQSVFLSVD